MATLCRNAAKAIGTVRNRTVSEETVRNRTVSEEARSEKEYCSEYERAKM